ncbi:MAG: hypothetical protein DRP95_04530, partial [Candidatus Latescibacterota bacterium]
MTGSGTLYVIDISDPSSPQEISSYYIGGGRSVTVLGNYAYVAAERYGLRVIDVSVLSSLKEVSSYDTKGFMRGVAVYRDYAYMAADDGLYIIDISDPSSPKEVGSYDENDIVMSDVAVSKGYAYITTVGRGLKVVDVSRPLSPKEVGSYGEGNMWSIEVSDRYAYVASGDEFHIIDISDPTSPRGIGSYKIGNEVRDIAVSDNYTYVLADSGLYVIDISDPTFPKEVSFYERMEDWGSKVAVAGDYVYVNETYSGLLIIDVSVPSSPSKADLYSTDGALGMTVSGGYAYVAGWNDFYVVDISDPTSPKEVGSYKRMEDWGGDVAVVGDYVYIADSGAGLYILRFTGMVDITVSAGSHTFSNIVVGSSEEWTLRVGNQGNKELVVDEVSLSGDEESFEVSEPSFTVPGKDEHHLKVTFAPSSPGLKRAILTIKSNDYDEGTVRIALSGRGLTPGRSIIVDASNTSDIEDGTPAHPYNTITEGVNAVIGGGDTIRVAEGVYNEEVVVPSAKSGNAEGFITILPKEGALVVLDGEGALSTGFTVEADYVKIKGFIVQNYLSDGICLTGCKSDIISGNVVRNNGGNGIKLRNVDDITIEGNICHHNKLAGIGNEFDQSTINSLFKNNLCYKNGRYGIYMAKSESGARNQLINNTVYGNTNTGIRLSHGASPLIENCIIANNTGFGISEDWVGENPTLKYNCIFGNTLGQYKLYSSEGNLSILNTSDEINTASTASWLGTPNVGNIVQDPMFVDASHIDYHLQAGSPCVDAGDPNSIFNDADGSVNDMGAYGGPGPVPGYFDDTPPGQVMDLRAYQTNRYYVTLTWTAPGDNGDIGSAATYDIRYATVPITEANWEEATPVKTTLPIPKVSGASEMIQVFGLPKDRALYFALKSVDEMLNWSGISNVAKVSLDRTAPSKPINLTANGSNPSPWKSTKTFTIDWTNPTDSTGIAGAWYKLGEAPSYP